MLIVLIIVLIVRGDEIDRVVLLELGADDYLVKLFGFRELVVCIGVVICCINWVMVLIMCAQRIGSLMIDRDVYRVFVDGGGIEVMSKEYVFLVMLVE